MSLSPEKLIFPLDTFYIEYDKTAPPIVEIDGAEMPEPYRSLLVGQHDMTPTLEAFHGDRLSLEVLDRHLEGNAYSRLVVLDTEKSGKAVEFGAIVINLEHFPGHARDLVLSGHTPLGTILALENIVHCSRPRAFVAVTPDDFILKSLRLQESGTLYGRRNVLLTESGAILADILEILPP